MIVLSFFDYVQDMLNTHFLICRYKTSMFGDLSINGKLDGSNYDMWCWKTQFLLNEHEVFEHLSATMSVPVNRDKDNKDITATEEYQASLVEYQEWCNKDRKACYTMLYCMHDDLIDEFELYPTAKEMWDNIRLRYDQTSEARLLCIVCQGTLFTSYS